MALKESVRINIARDHKPLLSVVGDFLEDLPYMFASKELHGDISNLMGLLEEQQRLRRDSRLYFEALQYLDAYRNRIAARIGLRQ